MIYKLIKSILTNEVNVIARFDDNSVTSFAMDENNPDYQTYLKWLEEGNTPLPADEPTADEISDTSSE
jgi:hypothetical protein